MIELVQLKKSFGTKEVLGGVDFFCPMRAFSLPTERWAWIAAQSAAYFAESQAR